MIQEPQTFDHPCIRH